MSQTEIQSLEILLKQAEGERDEALLALQQAQARAEHAKTQANQLESYRGQYQQRWQQQFTRQATVQILHCYQGFNERLEQAITHQQQTVNSSQAELERARTLLQERELRAASVRKLIERRRLELRRVEDRREQKLTDEAAQRAAWNTGLASRMAANQFS